MLDISRFDASFLPASARFSAWQRYVEDLHWEIGPLTPEGEIVASVDRWRVPGGFEIISMQAQDQALTTDDRGRPNEYWLALLLEGQIHVRAGHDTRALKPGDVVFGPLGYKLVFEISGRSTVRIVHLPRSGRVPRSLAAMTLKPIQSLPNDNGAARMLRALLETFGRAYGAMLEAEQRAIELSVSEFFIAALASVPDLSDMSASRAVLLGRAHEAIDHQLRDAGISPANVAPVLSISPRYLQQILSEGGEAFNLYVRRRRLENAYEELANPVYFRESISQICLRWGFNDSAYFSRAFKMHFGISPSQHRENRKRRDTASMGEPNRRTFEMS